MTEAEIYERMKPVFADVFDDDGIVIKPTTVAADVDGWDSLAHIRLVVALEQAFHVRFTAAEVSSFENVGQVVESIIKKDGR
ncbi:MULTISPECIES: acyl carrier protein [Bradyrhizobium]|uniref:Acyl carrier protein n=3 Tax=Bradyrhizobium TaxID=374 RepID=A0A1H5HSG4_9BRAD|nr:MULTISPECIES: acyl carrier protein [Bradyrhizobium]UFX47212.1 acyl carrier protein [Bradyrhizobium sp. 41S5]UGA45124.1 acyl carrier protein [Bradyrhizobium quebecense]UGY01382.1 acyl carrier protein [Bradyrhizobium quebecense]SEE30986.1 acyl carrier protein [Bradyrhizobium erythrophlei]